MRTTEHILALPAGKASARALEPAQQTPPLPARLRHFQHSVSRRHKCIDMPGKCDTAHIEHRLRKATRHSATLDMPTCATFLSVSNIRDDLGAGPAVHRTLSSFTTLYRPARSPQSAGTGGIKTLCDHPQWFSTSARHSASSHDTSSRDTFDTIPTTCPTGCNDMT